jgi:2-keto-4-pentenoate hydratase/2-oxohepta-3-ene-1,7-dioic acid hydratase in catechol pathway
MRYITFRTDDDASERVGWIDSMGAVHDLTPSIPAAPDGLSPMRRLINTWAEGEIAAPREGDVGIDPTTLTYLPVVPDASKIIAAPVNYRDHQSEMNEDAHIDGLGVFLKAPSSLVGNGGMVRLPYSDRRFDQEGEFAAVIGRTASHVPAADALDYVFGYTCLMDMTMRGGEDRSLRKSFDTFTPVGPSIATADEIGSITDLELHLWVNGELRQRADLSELIWDLPRLIEYASSVMTLLPGDIVTTGTPEGVGQIRDGDMVELEITGLDRLRVSVSDEGAVLCPTRGMNRGPKPPTELTPVFERAQARR